MVAASLWCASIRHPQDHDSAIAVGQGRQRFGQRLFIGLRGEKRSLRVGTLPKERLQLGLGHGGETAQDHGLVHWTGWPTAAPWLMISSQVCATLVTSVAARMVN